MLLWLSFLLMLGLFSVNGVVVAGYTGSGFGLCLGWFGCYRDFTLLKKKKEKTDKKQGNNLYNSWHIILNITRVETDKPTPLSLSCCPTYLLWSSRHLLLHRLLIGRRLTDMAPPAELTLSLWQPRRKNYNYYSLSPLLIFFNFSPFGLALIPLPTPPLRPGREDRRRWRLRFTNSWWISL